MEQENKEKENYLYFSWAYRYDVLKTMYIDESEFWVFQLEETSGNILSSAIILCVKNQGPKFSESCSWVVVLLGLDPKVWNGNMMEF